MTLVGFAVGLGPLWISAAAPAASATSTTPDAKLPHKKSAAKSGKKKPRTQPPLLTHAVKTPVQKKAPKSAGAPFKPSADIPLVIGTTSVWRGCLESDNTPREMATLASGLVMDESRLTTLLEGQGLFTETDSECVPYVAAAGGEDRGCLSHL